MSMQNTQITHANGEQEWVMQSCLDPFMPQMLTVYEGILRQNNTPLRVHVAALKIGHDEEKGAESCWRWYFRLSLRARLLPF